MKKVIVFCAVLAFLLGTVSPAYCGWNIKKLTRGISNMVTCPLEIPNRIGKAYKKFGFFNAATSGFTMGFVMMVYRAVVGADETLTFYKSASENGAPAINDPEFFFGPSAKPGSAQDAEDESDIQDRASSVSRDQGVSDNAEQKQGADPELVFSSEEKKTI